MTETTETHSDPAAAAVAGRSRRPGEANWRRGTMRAAALLARNAAPGAFRRLRSLDAMPGGSDGAEAVASPIRLGFLRVWRRCPAQR